MEIRQLRYFIAVVELGSLTKAAERVHVAQPALSQQMAALERDLGASLLVRSAQGVRPTAAGENLYRHAQTILRQVEQAGTEIKSGHAGESGTVRIGMPATIASMIAVPLLTRLRQQHPGIHLCLFESSGTYLTELLIQGRLEMCILFRDMQTSGVACEALIEESLYIFGAAKVDGKQPKIQSLADLAGLPMVLPSSDQNLRILVQRSFAHAGWKLNVVADIDSLVILASAAAAGLGYTLLPWSAITHLAPGRRSAQCIVDSGLSRKIGLCWPTSLPTSAPALTVRLALTQTVHELVESGRWKGARLHEITNPMHST